MGRSIRLVRVMRVGVVLQVGLVWLAAAGAAAPPEPGDYRSGAMQGAVPETLGGATVLHDAAAAKAWIAANQPVIIDVAPAPVKPPSMAAGAPWLPAAHQDIPGSAWLPDAGRLLLTPDGADAYRRAVLKLAGSPPGKPLLAYCHPNCWASWNAARFLVRAGYAHVAWFPGGIEAWAAADNNLQKTTAMAGWRGE